MIGIHNNLEMSLRNKELQLLQLLLLSKHLKQNKLQILLEEIKQVLMKQTVKMLILEEDI